MTRTEAAQLLGVSEDVGLDELQRKYESLHNDYRIRLTNAPTAGLRTTFEQKLQDLANARGTLADLPSSDPVSAPEPRPSVAPGTVPETRRSRAGEHRRGEEHDGGLPRSTMIAAVIAIVLAGALAYVSLRGHDESSPGKPATDGVERAAGQQPPAFADRLRVRNDSKHSAKILAAAFVYRDAAGALQSEHSYEIGTTGHRPAWVIAAGNTVELDSAMERGRTWSGPVVFYSFVIEYPGQEPYLQTGIWAEDVDGPDHAISLKLD